MINSKQLLLVVFILFAVKISAQEINFNDLSFGIALEYSTPSGDFGKFWNNAPGIGGIINYKLTKFFYFETILSISYFIPKQDERKYPKIIFLNIPAGINYSLEISKLNTNFGAGISNSTLAFIGKAAEKVEENYIESEFGVFISFGIEKNINNVFDIQLFTNAQNIFTYPENIILYKFGFKILFN